MSFLDILLECLHFLHFWLLTFFSLSATPKPQDMRTLIHTVQTRSRHCTCDQHSPNFYTICSTKHQIPKPERLIHHMKERSTSISTQALAPFPKFESRARDSAIHPHARTPHEPVPKSRAVPTPHRKPRAPRLDQRLAGSQCRRNAAPAVSVPRSVLLRDPRRGVQLGGFVCGKRAGPHVWRGRKHCYGFWSCGPGAVVLLGACAAWVRCCMKRCIACSQGMRASCVRRMCSMWRMHAGMGVRLCWF
jgi:hypothetical protein